MDVRALLFVSALLLVVPAASACVSCTAYTVSVAPACEDACPVLVHGEERTLPLQVEVAWQVTGSPVPVEGNPDATKDVLVALEVPGRPWLQAKLDPASFWFSPLRDGEPEPASPGVPIGEVVRWSHTRQVELALTPDFAHLAGTNGSLDVPVLTHIQVPDHPLGASDTFNLTTLPLAWDPGTVPATADAAAAQTMPSTPLTFAVLGALAVAWRRRP